MSSTLTGKRPALTSIVCARFNLQRSSSLLVSIENMIIFLPKSSQALGADRPEIQEDELRLPQGDESVDEKPAGNRASS